MSQDWIMSVRVEDIGLGQVPRVIAALRDRATKVDAENSRLRQENARLSRESEVVDGDYFIHVRSGHNFAMVRTPPRIEL